MAGSQLNLESLVRVVATEVRLHPLHLSLHLLRLPGSCFPNVVERNRHNPQGVVAGGMEGNLREGGRNLRGKGGGDSLFHGGGDVSEAVEGGIVVVPDHLSQAAVGEQGLGQSPGSVITHPIPTAWTRRTHRVRQRRGRGREGGWLT